MRTIFHIVLFFILLNSSNENATSQAFLAFNKSDTLKILKDIELLQDTIKFRAEYYPSPFNPEIITDLDTLDQYIHNSLIKILQDSNSLAEQSQIKLKEFLNIITSDDKKVKVYTFTNNYYGSGNYAYTIIQFRKSDNALKAAFTDIDFYVSEVHNIGNNIWIFAGAAKSCGWCYSTWFSANEISDDGVRNINIFPNKENEYVSNLNIHWKRAVENDNKVFFNPQTKEIYVTYSIEDDHIAETWNEHLHVANKQGIVEYTLTFHETKFKIKN